MGEVGEGLLDIAEVGRAAGLAPSALRFYERKGLITPAGRLGLRRAYARGVLDRLALITAARGAGFTLSQIGELLAARPSDAALRERLAAKASELDERITQLTAVRDSLHHAAACKHDPLIECPRFLHAIRHTQPYS
jgi:DNA-binding transcriptional MerR regulator